MKYLKMAKTSHEVSKDKIMSQALSSTLSVGRRQRKLSDSTYELSEFYRQKNKQLLSLVIRCAQGQQDEGEDPVSDLYVLTLDGKAKDIKVNHLHIWSYATFRRLAIAHRRTKTRRITLFKKCFTYHHKKVTTASPERILEKKYQLSKQALILSSALRQLSPRQREVLHLFIHDTLTFEAIANALELNVGSIRTH